MPEAIRLVQARDNVGPWQGPCCGAGEVGTSRGSDLTVRGGHAVPTQILLIEMYT